MSGQFPITSPWLVRAIISVSLLWLPSSARDRYRAEWMAELEEMQRQSIHPLLPAIRILLGAPSSGQSLRAADQEQKNSTVDQQTGIAEQLLTAGWNPIWSRSIPHRNPHFTGQSTILKTLREILTSPESSPAQVSILSVCGLGGIGKTEIACEYTHRYARNYDLVWWIRAEQEDTIRNALIALGQRIGLQPTQYHPSGGYPSAEEVLEALRIGKPYDRWLLIFDNATQPEIVAQYIPRGSGHVIVTSRIAEWRRSLQAQVIEVSQFTSEECTEFLRRRAPFLASTEDPAKEAARQADARRLAEALENLPLAAEHAAAYLVETGASVEEYLRLFQRNVHQLLSQDIDIYYPQSIATTWSFSLEHLSPEADSLFKFLAFFSPEPVAEELLVQHAPKRNLPTALTTALSDRQAFRSAAQELARYSLIKINSLHKTVQTHRVVQAAIRGLLERQDPDTASAYRAVAHAVLTSSDANSPDDEANDSTYE